ncbi:hypothetical protein [Microseira sp. BLCC-F43]|uniref:hypothetical protein n=1 Tax=Microseira sp. BLCC-F43 TaxID=3153602 RepID=UPI0035B92BFF
MGIYTKEGTGKREEGTGKRERGRGKRERGRGKRERGRGNGERGRGNGERGRGNGEEEIGKTVRCSLFPVPFFDDYLEALLDGKLDAETEVEAQPDSATEETDSNDDKTSIDSSKYKQLNWLEDWEQLVEEYDSTNSQSNPNPKTLKSKSGGLNEKK